MNFLRRKVSLKKKRWQADGFDLDLAYITERIIAMGVPAFNYESIFRNRIQDVKKFLEAKHSDHYKVYNLCNESKYQYETEEFKGRVLCFPFADHNCPPLGKIESVCKDMDNWLQEDSRNVVAIHCKAGKGRTGVLICCYLIHSKLHPTSEDALSFYAHQRTKNGKGLTIPSQIRFVRYYEQTQMYGGMPLEPTIKILHILINSKHYKNATQSEPMCEIYEGANNIEIPKYETGRSKPNQSGVAQLTVNLSVQGDVKIVVKDKQFKYHFWFNTAFIDNNRLVLTKPEIDSLWKDKKDEKVLGAFTIEVIFDGAPVSAMNKQINHFQQLQLAKSRSPKLTASPKSSPKPSTSPKLTTKQ